jgi:hypothetical protein
MKYFILAFFLILLAGCDNNAASDVKQANGETPVRWVLCSLGGNECYVGARFRMLDSCERHKEWSDMLCDKTSIQGTMTCIQNIGKKIGTAYCTY